MEKIMHWSAIVVLPQRMDITEVGIRVQNHEVEAAVAVGREVEAENVTGTKTTCFA